MMLDAKATFDELVRKHAPDEETRDRILQNRIYRQISNALAGSQEYMAMEKLFEIHQEGRFDFLVLDTPPSRNALDFLDAPKRLTQFIEGRGMQMFMKPTGMATRVVGRGSSMMFSVLKRVVGIDLLADLGEFFQAFSGMVDGFRERAKRVNELLADPATSLHDRLRPPGRADRGGRLLPPQAGRGEAAGRRRDRQQGPLRDRGGPGRATGSRRSWAACSRMTWPSAWSPTSRDYQALAKRDAANVEHLARELEAKQVIRVPYMDEDVHDLGGLLKINRYLFASEAAAPGAGGERRGLAGVLALVPQFAHVPVGRVGDREQVADAVGGILVELALLTALAARARERRPVNLSIPVAGAEPVGLRLLPVGTGMVLGSHHLR